MTMLSIHAIPRQQRRRAPACTFAPAFVVGLLLALHASVVVWFSEPVASFGPAAALQGHHHRNRIFSSVRLASSSIAKQPTPESQTEGRQPPDLHVVVVGGGVGGMVVAARIASEQQSTAESGVAKPKTRVTLLEKNAEIGGRCGSFWVDPERQDETRVATNDDGNTNTNTTTTTHLFRHEQGPSLLLLPSVYEDVFKETTSKTALDYGLEIVPCAPAYQIVFDDGDRISVGFPKDSSSSKTTSASASIREEEVVSRSKLDGYEENGASKWDDYMAITEAYLDAGLPNFIEERLDPWSLPNFLFHSLKDFGKAWPLKPHSEVLDALFESNKLKALASFQDLYVGLEPYKNSKLPGGGVLQSTAPAVFGLLAAIELHPSNKKAGVFAPIGGFQSVTKAFENLLDDLGVEIRCDTTVSGVTNEGVWARTKNTKNNNNNDGSEFIPADLVIVNADLPYAKKSLLVKENSEGGAKQQVPPSTDRFDWDDKFSFSSGVISFYWSLDKPLDDLNTHNVFLSTKTRSEAEASWQVLREPTTPFSGDDVENGDESPFNFYVHRPSKTDPSAAPPGRDTIMVLVPCRTLLRDEDCSKLPRDQAIQKYQEQFSQLELSKVKSAVLKRFAAVESLKDLEDHILHEECRTPATWADRYNLAAGTPFALSHGFSQLSLTRPGPKSTGLPNVLYCGASTRPGNGVPLVLIGAKQVAEKAMQCLFPSSNTDLDE